MSETLWLPVQPCRLFLDRVSFISIRLEGLESEDLTLAELDVLVLTSFIKLIKLLQNLIKLLPNHIMV